METYGAHIIRALHRVVDIAVETHYIHIIVIIGNIAVIDFIVFPFEGKVAIGRRRSIGTVIVFVIIIAAAGGHRHCDQHSRKEQADLS